MHRPFNLLNKVDNLQIKWPTPLPWTRSTANVIGHLILVEKCYWLNKTNYNFNSHKKFYLFSPSHFLPYHPTVLYFPPLSHVHSSSLQCLQFTSLPTLEAAGRWGEVVLKHGKPRRNLRFQPFTRRLWEATEIPARWGIFNSSGHFISGTSLVQNLARLANLGQIKAS